MTHGRPRTKFMCRDAHGILHEVIWLIGVAYVLRCTGELPVYMHKGSVAGNATTCLRCIGAT
jgi:hypothetical protein